MRGVPQQLLMCLFVWAAQNRERPVSFVPPGIAGPFDPPRCERRQHVKAFAINGSRPKVTMKSRHSGAGKNYMNLGCRSL
jgi:hypothetical protein